MGEGSVSRVYREHANNMVSSSGIGQSVGAVVTIMDLAEEQKDADDVIEREG